MISTGTPALASDEHAGPRSFDGSLKCGWKFTLLQANGVERAVQHRDEYLGRVGVY